MLRKVFRTGFIIFLLITISLSFSSCGKKPLEEIIPTTDDRIFFSTEFFYCRVDDNKLTITGLTGAALEQEELIIPVYIIDKCVTELYIDRDIEDSNIKKIFVQHPLVVNFDDINKSDKKFILNFEPNFNFFETAVNVPVKNDFQYLEDYFEQFIASKVVFAPEMIVQSLQNFLSETFPSSFENEITELETIEDEIYDYLYFNTITNISYRYNLQASEFVYYWADHAAPGETIQPPPDPKRNGYIFGGWFTDEALTQLFDFENDIPFEATAVQNTEGEESNTEQEEAQQEPFEPFSLYAKWVSRG